MDGGRCGLREGKPRDYHGSAIKRQHGDGDIHVTLQNQRPDATCLAGLPKPDLRTHFATSGAGFTAALWEQSQDPLGTLFGLKLCNRRLLKNINGVCEETFGKMDVDHSPNVFLDTLFYRCEVGCFLVCMC